MRKDSSTGGMLVDPKCWILAKADLWMDRTVLQCRATLRFIHLLNISTLIGLILLVMDTRVKKMDGPALLLRQILVCHGHT